MRCSRVHSSYALAVLGLLLFCGLIWPHSSRSEGATPAVAEPGFRVSPPDSESAEVQRRAVISPRDAVGYSDLLAELGSLPDGAGLAVGQVEAGGSAYLPDLTVPAFAGKTIVDGTGFNLGSYSHATGVGQRQYGSEISLSPGVSDITVYQADDYLFSVIGFGSGLPPLAQPFAVMNHSYVGSGAGAVIAQELNRRMDVIVEQENAVVVVATNNGASSPLPEFFAQTYNTITVGRSDGDHAAGLTTLNESGRIKPDIVAPEGTVSNSAPMVAAAASVLLERGQATGNPNSTQNEVVKAVLLAGATKDEFTGWSNSDLQPLDLVYGAGELNIYNSYFILEGGEFPNSSTGGAPPLADGRGWDYEPEIVPLQDRDYRLEIGVPSEVSIALTWNAQISDAGGALDYDTLELPTLELYLQDASESFPGVPLAVSTSTVDNVQHIHARDVSAGTYTMTVRSIDGTTDYGLAWRVDGAAPVSAPGSGARTGLRLHEAQPNPFNPSTVIRFDVAVAGPVELAVFDVAGRRVRTLVHDSREAGSYRVSWNGRDEAGRPVASGVYLYELRAGSEKQTRRMTLVK